MTNHHQTINDASQRRKEVLPIPPAFEDYDGFNDFKRKKLKAMQLSQQTLDSHSQALYSLLMKPVLNSSPAWKNASCEIQQLAECLKAYKDFLIKQNEIVHSNHALEHPVKTIDKEATVEHRNKTPFIVKHMYSQLDKAVTEAENSYVVFDEDLHVPAPFETNYQRYQYFKNLQLSVPIDIVRFSPGGSVISTVCIVKVTENRTDAQLLTEGARFLQRVRTHLKECHTRQQRRLFKSRLRNVASVLPSVADLIYKELTLDASVSSHPVTQERLRLIFLGETGLLTDLRHINAGRPNNVYDTFFSVLSGIVDNISAADDRRHGIAHMSEFISLDEMIMKAKEACPEGSPIPSKSLVRLQFAPRNPYSKVALNFTSRLQVQYKVQRRQLRVSHPDDHFCQAQFRYLKEMAIQLKENAVLMFCDDKAKVPLGDPGSAVSSGVRGKKSIVPTSTTLASLDHDMTKASITPSVMLRCNVPETINGSFVQGKVTTVVNDSVFQQASPFRHAAILSKLLSNSEMVPPVLLKFTDGGTDQRNTLESVRCACICLFREFNLDMLVLARCAPGHSYTNPAERIMSILNVGLQNVALERSSCSDAVEQKLRRCNSMANIRTAATKQPDLREAWVESVEPVLSLIRNRFTRLKLKDEPFDCLDPATELEIDNLKRHLRELFPDLDLNKLQKVHTAKSQTYNTWVSSHCRLRHYTFQIRKCKDENCCLATRIPYEELSWLPDPVIDDSGDHYKPYTEVKGQDTNDENRPSLKDKTKGKKSQKAPVQPAAEPFRDEEPATETPEAEPGQAEELVTEPGQAEEPATEPRQAEEPATEPRQAEEPATEPRQAEEPATEPRQAEEPATEPRQAEEPATEPRQAEEQATETPATEITETVMELAEEQEEYKDPAPPVEDPHLCTKQNARAIVTCTECRKPRVIFSKQRLSERLKISVTIAVSEFDYTCGAPLLPPSNTSYEKVMCRSTLNCGTPVELQYYGSSLGRQDICCHCCAEEVEVLPELKDKYQTVLPICKECIGKGKPPVVKRPYGKNIKKSTK